MRFQVLLSLWSDTSCSCIDKIPEVTKTKDSKQKRYSLSKLRFYHSPLKQLIQTRPPHVYVTVWEILHNTVQMYMQWKKAELLFFL